MLAITIDYIYYEEAPKCSRQKQMYSKFNMCYSSGMTTREEAAKLTFPVCT